MEFLICNHAETCDEPCGDDRHAATYPLPRCAPITRGMGWGGGGRWGATTAHQVRTA